MPIPFVVFFKKHRHKILGVYVFMVFSLALVIAYKLLVIEDITLNRDIIIFGVLCIIADMLPVRLPRGGCVTVGFAANYACILVLGPVMAGLVAMLGGIAPGIRTKSSMSKIVFNLSQVFITVTVSGLVFGCFGGRYDSITNTNVLIPFVWGVVVYFLLNSTLVTAAVALDRWVGFWSIWVFNVKRTIPSYLALAPLAYLIAVVYIKIGVLGVVFFLVPLLLARYSFQQYTNMRQVYLGTISALAHLVDAKDPYTHGHSERVRNSAVKVGRWLRLGEETIEQIEFAALLHDVGKIGVREGILNKPGKLDSIEFEHVKKHPTIGNDVISKIDFLKEVSKSVRAHHERIDGNGYPDGLKGKDIPLVARILSVVDAYDAMTSDRPYRAALSRKEAMERLKEGKGSQFDSKIVDAFIEILKREETE